MKRLMGCAMTTLLFAGTGQAVPEKVNATKKATVSGVGQDSQTDCRETPKWEQKSTDGLARAVPRIVALNVPEMNRPHAEVRPQRFENLPGDRNGDGRLSREEGKAVGSNPELLGEMVNHPQALEIGRQQYRENADFREKVNKIKRNAHRGDHVLLHGVPFLAQGILKQTGLSEQDAVKLIRLAKRF